MPIRLCMMLMAGLLTGACHTGEKPAAQPTFARHVQIDEQGFVRNDRWSPAEVRMTLVEMARDYGWAAAGGREFSRAGGPGGYRVAQVYRTYRTPGGEAVTVHIVDEAGHGVRVFVSSDPWDEGLVAAVAGDLGSRIERRKQGLPPPPPSQRLSATRGE